MPGEGIMVLKPWSPHMRHMALEPQHVHTQTGNADEQALRCWELNETACLRHLVWHVT